MASSSPYGTREKPALARGAGGRVLVVVREPGLAELLSTTPELAGYRISLADSGADASVRVARHRFDLVVLDGELPTWRTWGGSGRPPSLIAPRSSS